MKNLRYCPELNTITGSVTASLLMCQLEYWFNKKGNKPFYKFLGPCEDKHYHTGDSWTEELGFTKAEFRTAFSKIGITYKSKTAYKASCDPFEGKLYLSYYDRSKNLTYYMRNHTLVNKLLENQDCALPYFKDYNSSKITHNTYSNLDLTCSFADSAYDQNHDSTPVHTSSHTHSLTNLFPCPLTPYDKIIDLFHKCCPSLSPITRLNNACKLKLDQLYRKLTQKGEDALALIEKAFTLVEASDFLCGCAGKRTWKAAFGWIIRLDKFFSILDGRYAPFSPKTTSYTSASVLPSPYTAPPKPTSNFMRMYTHDFNIKELEAREQAYIESRYGLS